MPDWIIIAVHLTLIAWSLREMVTNYQQWKHNSRPILVHFYGTLQLKGWVIFRRYAYAVVVITWICWNIWG